MNRSMPPLCSSKWGYFFIVLLEEGTGNYELRIKNYEWAMGTLAIEISPPAPLLPLLPLPTVIDIIACQ
jgi:hypothetical protein